MTEAPTRVFYLCFTVQPTRQAHGLQILKMSEGLAQAGAETTLLYQRIRNNPYGDADKIGEYYNTGHKNLSFDNFWTLATPLGAADEPWRTVLRYYFSVPYFKARLRHLGCGPGSVVYVRQRRPLQWLLPWRDRLGFKLVYELHSCPRSDWEVEKCSQVDTVVAISEHVRQQYIARGVPADRIVVEHDGFDPKEFDPMPTKEEARQALGIPQDEFVVGYVGRFSLLGGDKGLRPLIEAVVQLNDPKTRLCLVGYTEEEAQQLEAFAAERGLRRPLFHYLGRADRAKLPVVLAAMDVPVNPLPDTPHNQGASPLKLFEYMAARRPTVATRLQGTMEVMVHERNALLVEPDNAASMAEALQRLRDEPGLAQRLGETAWQDVQRYAWQHRAERILSFVQNRPASGKPAG